MGDLEFLAADGYDAAAEAQNANTGDFQPLPPGWYQVSIEKAELKTTKAGTGKYVKLMMTVLGPTGSNRKVFTNINIVNPNPTAQQIGRREMGALQMAIGKPRATDTAELIGGVLDVKLAIETNSAGGGDNVVKAYRACGSGGALSYAQKDPDMAAPAPAAATPAPAITAAAVPAQSAKPKMPWEK